jgi:hypothetical protein
MIYRTCFFTDFNEVRPLNQGEFITIVDLQNSTLINYKTVSVELNPAFWLGADICLSFLVVCSFRIILFLRLEVRLNKVNLLL